MQRNLRPIIVRGIPVSVNVQQALLKRMKERPFTTFDLIPIAVEMGCVGGRYFPSEVAQGIILRQKLSGNIERIKGTHTWRWKAEFGGFTAHELNNLSGELEKLASKLRVGKRLAEEGDAA